MALLPVARVHRVHFSNSLKFSRGKPYLIHSNCLDDGDSYIPKKGTMQYTAINPQKAKFIAPTQTTQGSSVPQSSHQTEASASSSAYGSSAANR